MCLRAGACHSKASPLSPCHDSEPIPCKRSCTHHQSHLENLSHVSFPNMADFKNVVSRFIGASAARWEAWGVPALES
eukprot:scaffold4465_cov21-Tisochrysis_lutea.AAC.1